MITVNGWTLYTHPLFAGQIEKFTAAVGKSRAKDPDDHRSTANAKLFAAMRKLMFEVIPVDPARPKFGQGGTLGPSRRYWFRAKFGKGRFRLLFRYSSSAKIIIYAWVYDANTLRTYGSKSDGCAGHAHDPGARDCKVDGDTLGCFWHGIDAVSGPHRRIDGAPSDCRIANFCIAGIGALGLGHDEGRAAHVFNPACDHQASITTADCACSCSDCIKAGAAQAIHS